MYYGSIGITEKETPQEVKTLVDSFLDSNSRYLESIGFDRSQHEAAICSRVESIQYDKDENEFTAESTRYLAWLLRMLESTPASMHKKVCDLNWNRVQNDMMHTAPNQDPYFAFADKIGNWFADEADDQLRKIYFSPLHAPYLGMTQDGKLYYRNPANPARIVNVNYDDSATRTFARALSNLASILDGTKNRYSSHDNARLVVADGKLTLDAGELNTGVYAKASIKLYGPQSNAAWNTVVRLDTLSELCKFGEQSAANTDMVGIAQDDRGNLQIKIGVGSATLKKHSLPTTQHLYVGYRFIRAYNANKVYTCETPKGSCNWRMYNDNKPRRTLRRSIRRNARLSRFTKHLNSNTVDFPEYESEDPQFSFLVDAGKFARVLNGAFKVAQTSTNTKTQYVELVVSPESNGSTLSAYASNGYLMHIDTMQHDSTTHTDTDRTVKIKVDHESAIKRFLSYCESVLVNVHERYVEFEGTLKGQDYGTAVSMILPVHVESFSLYKYDSENKQRDPLVTVTTDGYQFLQTLKGLTNRLTYADKCVMFEVKSAETPQYLILTTQDPQTGNNTALLNHENSNIACNILTALSPVSFSGKYMLEFLGKLMLAKGKIGKAEQTLTFSYGTSDQFMTMQCKGKTLKLMPMTGTDGK